MNLDLRDCTIILLVVTLIWALTRRCASGLPDAAALPVADDAHGEQGIHEVARKIS